MAKKNYQNTFVLLIISFVFISCEDDFSPKTSLAEKFVLFSAIEKNDKSISVNISKVYDVEAFNPNNFKIDPTIKNAVVKIYSRGDFIYLLEKNTANGICYTNRIGNNFLADGMDVSVKANLPGGSVLTAKTKIVKDIYPELSFPFFNGFTTEINQFLWGNTLKLSWNYNKSGHLFFTDLSVHYSEKVGTAEVFFEKKIPAKLIKNNGFVQEYYPNAQFQTQCEYDFEAIDSALSALGKNKINKSDIKLYHLDLSIIEYDDNLTKYYSSIHGYLDRFSIKLDESVYSNIEGGIGLFGTYTRSKSFYFFHPDYGKKFGYMVFTEREQN